MTDAPPAPTPLYLLRAHSAPVSALALSPDNARIYSADASGRVVVTSTHTLRPLAAWQAHDDSILGVEEWADRVITHSRDHKLHVWRRAEEVPAAARIGPAALPSLAPPAPQLVYSIDVNALNFCRFALMPLQSGAPVPVGVDAALGGDRDGGADGGDGGGGFGGGGPRALLALPNLVESDTADVWVLPARTRLHGAVGQVDRPARAASTPGSRNTTGIIMALHLFQRPGGGALRLLAGYEDGSVVLREYTRGDRPSVEGAGWAVVWKAKVHGESVMAMRVSRAGDFALTVSADHIVGRYNLADDAPADGVHGIAMRTKHAGNSAVALRDDGRVCAVGGWDGRVRLYSTKTFKPLGTLRYHKAVCQCVEFARKVPEGSAPANNGDRHDEQEEEEEDEEEEMTAAEKEERTRWLVTGSKDNRVAIWSLLSFEK